MPIPFCNKMDISSLKQALYNLLHKDRKAANEILDPLYKDGVVKPVPLGQPSLAASLAFVVQKGSKLKVVVDLHCINTKMFIDAYPLLQQDTILQALGGSVIFSLVDIVKSFFQQLIASKDRQKTAFVT